MNNKLINEEKNIVLSNVSFTEKNFENNFEIIRSDPLFPNKETLIF